MKFGDKLISLRKKNGLSQEELASKLNVSRQSVSKWESNNTYPETDKIIQICNIFDCRMDDLINDKVVDVSQLTRKSKNNFSFIFDSFLEFVTKSINMFGSMKFTSGLKCVFELGILIFCLFLLVMIISECGAAVIMKLFSFVPYNVNHVIREIISAVLEIIGIGFSIIVVVHVFKIRYLDYYDKLMSKEIKKNETNDHEETRNKNKEEIENVKKTKFNLKKEPKVVIRDEKHTTFAFLTVISKIIIWMVKAFVVMFALCFIVSLVSLVICLVLSISLSKYSMLFIGTDLGLVAAIIINILILLLMVYFIINKKANSKIFSFIFLGALVLMGVGIGIGLIGMTEFRIIDNEIYEGEEEQKTKYIDVVDNMVIYSISEDGYTITIDDSMNNETLKIIGTQEKDFFKDIEIYEGDYYGMNYYHLQNISYLNFDTMINLAKKDLKNKTFRSYNVGEGNFEIICNRKVAKMLLENAKKIHLVRYSETSTGYHVKDYKQKIYSSSSCEVKYDALTGRYTYDKSCVCDKKVISTSDGDKIKFECYYKASELE